MSAFIVTDYHINVLVSYAVRNQAYFRNVNQWDKFSYDNAEALAHTLYQANVASVNYRYNDDGSADDFEFELVNTSQFSHADIIKACDCLDYQSCERDDWEQSHANKVLRGIREKAIRNVCEVSDVWELTPEKHAA